MADGPDRVHGYIGSATIECSDYLWGRMGTRFVEPGMLSPTDKGA